MRQKLCFWDSLLFCPLEKSHSKFETWLIELVGFDLSYFILLNFCFIFVFFPVLVFFLFFVFCFILLLFRFLKLYVQCIHLKRFGGVLFSKHTTYWNCIFHSLISIVSLYTYLYTNIEKEKKTSFGITSIILKKGRNEKQKKFWFIFI